MPRRTSKPTNSSAVGGVIQGILARLQLSSLLRRGLLDQFDVPHCDVLSGLLPITRYPVIPLDGLRHIHTLSGPTSSFPNRTFILLQMTRRHLTAPTTA